jgi:DNA polymerase III subunit alpha
MKSSTGKDENLTTAGMITNLRVQKSKRGEFWAQGQLEDLSGSIDMLIFPEAYRKLQERLKVLTDVPVLVRAGVRIEEGANPKLTVNEVSSLEEVKVPLPRSLRIRIPLEKASETTVDELHLLFSQRKGEAKVLFDVERMGDFMVVMEAEGYNVLPDRNFILRVQELCGRDSIRVIN